MAELRHLKMARSAAKGLITRKQNEIKELLLSADNLDSIKEKLPELDVAMNNFKTAHEVYHANLSDEIDIEESHEYFVAELARVCSLKERIDSIATAVTLEKRSRNPKPDDDSQSNVTSCRSSRSGARLKAAAKRASLKAEAALLKKRQALQEEELRLQQRKEQLDLETELAKAEAEEMAYDSESSYETINDSSEESGADDEMLSTTDPGPLPENKGTEIDPQLPLENKGTEIDPQLPPENGGAEIDRQLPPENERTDINPQLPREDIKTENDSELPPQIKTEIDLEPPPQDVKPTINAKQTDDVKPKKVVESFSIKTETSDTLLDVISAQQIRTQQIESLLMQQQRHTLALMLPQPQVPIFDGDPIEYCNFIRAFENIIELKTDSDSARLYYLVQYTTGDVKELMQSCLSMKPSEGYREARRLLKQRYGQDYKIATSYVNKLTEGPPIRTETGEALRKFSTLLTSCRNTLKEIGYSSKIENPDTLKRIVDRLPFSLRLKWRDIADTVTEKKGREITVDDLASFVEDRARIAAHPVFGNLSSDNSTKFKESKIKEERSPRKAVSTFAAHADAQSPKTSYDTNNKNTSGHNSAANQRKPLECPSCQSSHWLSQCSDFRRMSLEDRHKLVRNKGLCDNCLTGGHIASSCPKSSFCKVDGCTQTHSTFLHPKREATTVAPRNGYVSSQHSLSKLCKRDVTALPIVPVKVRAKGSKRTVDTYAFLDNGSDATFCTNRLKNTLKLEGQQTTMLLTTLGKAKSREPTEVISLEVSDLVGANHIELPIVLTCPELPVSTDSKARLPDIERWPHLKDITIEHIDADVNLLIGSDVPRALQPQEVKGGRGEEPFAMKTALGWAVVGPLGRKSGDTNTVNLIKSDVNLESQFERFCNMEFNDALYDNNKAMSKEDKRALKVMEESAQLKDGHYELSLPWKHQPPHLENNKVVAERRLDLLKKRLNKDPELLEKYTGYMNDILQKDYARWIPEEMLNEPNKLTWYLPHHPIFHPQKPGKLRVVFDCSAKYNGTSLNEQLLQGPDLTNSLVGVLTRFREEPVAFMSDVEAMFHQVRVADQDCDALRFLWWPDGNMQSSPQEYQMRVHLFGGTSSPSCANFALRKTACDNEGEFDEEAIETVKRNFYVDDCLKSVETEAAAIQLVDQLRTLLARGGFRLTKWLCNSPEVTKSVPESERASSAKNLDFDKEQVERALGIRWDVKSDKFGFKIDLKDKPSTRRGILSVVSSVYDPLGFAAPFILPAKMLLQDLCRKKLDWDEDIGREDSKRWNAWKTNLPKLEGLVVNRCLKPKDFGKIVTSQLHNFSDASQHGYGAVMYLRIVNTRGQVHCSFIIGKARLAPLKPLTVPRMELSAAVLATKLDRTVKQELNIPLTHESLFWTDSTCVLGYVENESKRFHTFVANRIAAIHDATSPSQWRYVNTSANPADEASRGLPVTESLDDVRWVHGPPFLWQPEALWPKRPTIAIQIEENDPEVKREVASCAATVKPSEDFKVTEIFQRFSSWVRLKKFVAWMLRLKRNLRKSASKAEEKTSKVIEPLTVDEMNEAEYEIMKCVQSEHFSEELNVKKGDVPKKSSSIYKLDPMLSHGLLRVGGRLKNADMEFQAKHPILLPKQHHVSTLIARHYHEASAHSGAEHVLSLIREKFWIIDARALLRRINHSCVTCKRKQGPVCEQKMADLPGDRVKADKPPFTFVGVDYFGPFTVKRGRSQVKRYGALFTCLTTRAIHIEVAHSLNTDSFINCMRRFIARRGAPQEMRSDNGTNFVSGEKELRKAIAAWNQEQIHSFLLQREVKWTFNPPAGSHHGGVWERCIRTVRKVMNGLMKEQILDDEGLITLMCEVESIVNSRPITKSSEDPKDLEALTPNHLLLLRGCPNKPPGVFEDSDSYARRRWRQVQHLANVFWRRWVREYLPSLQARQKWCKERQNLAVNDIVLVVDDTVSRGCWPLGRILEVHQNSKDGLVRRVVVKTKASTLTRPVDKVVLLEADQR